MASSSAPVENAWRAIFLAALAESSNVSASARKAEVSTQLVYRLRREDAAFRRAWFDALCEGFDNLEIELLGRARDGELVGASKSGRRQRKHDNALGLRLLAAHRDTVIRLRAERSHRDEEAIFAAIDAKLDRLRQAKAASAGVETGDND